MPKQKLPRNSFLNDRFGAALREFGVALVKSDAIKHRGNKGSSREESLRSFFRERLPSRYAVVQGEVVDLRGQTSPQLDVLFFDQSQNFALVADTSHILPAEALLASIEVKSKLTKAEIEKSAAAAELLRKLQPFGRNLAGTDIGDLASRMSVARYFHCVFAYDTDLATDNWSNREAERFKTLCGDTHAIDAVYVLDRGLLNIPHKTGMIEDSEGGAITNFYFSILNFLQREGGRRAATPFDRYVTHASKSWSKLI
jgi:hypothetical protein